MGLAKRGNAGLRVELQNEGGSFDGRLSSESAFSSGGHVRDVHGTLDDDAVPQRFF